MLKVWEPLTRPVPRGSGSSSRFNADGFPPVLFFGTILYIQAALPLVKSFSFLEHFGDRSFSLARFVKSLSWF